MRLFKKSSVAVVLALCFMLSACDFINDINAQPSPNLAPHFISESERDTEPYIKMVELAKDDPSMYAYLTTEGANAQLKELFDIIVYQKKVPVIDVSLGTLNSAVFQTWEAIEGLFLEITNKNMTDFERLHAFHDWLVYNVEYDFESFLASQTGGEILNRTIFNAYGALHHKKAVCEGLSEAFAILTSLAGMESVVVYGTLDDGSHAWNKVKLNDIWYNVDTTASANYIQVDGQKSKLLTHAFMLISDEEITDPVIGRHEFYDDEMNPINPPCDYNYDYYVTQKLYSVGSMNFYSKIKSKQELLDAFSFVKSQGRKVGKLEVQLDFETESDFEDELSEAYALVRNSDFKVSANSKPYIRLPNNVFLLLIYK